MKSHWKTRRAGFLVAAATLITCHTAPGAGFALHEHSISGLGVGFASGAASGEDNSSMFFNPATLTLTDGPQVTTGLHLIFPKAEFNNKGTLSGFVPGSSPGVPTQGGEATSEKSAEVPNFFYSQPVGQDLVFGLGFSSPYGLATDYDKGWVGRYVALETDLMTINGNAALAWQVSEQVSLGVGLSAVYGDALLSNAINFGLAYLNGLNSGTIPATPETLALAQDVQASLGSSAYDGSLRLEGDDWGYGFNFGILITPTASTRIGLHYRSSVKLELSGTADFTVGALEAFFGSAFVDQGGKVDLELPDTAQVSIHHQLTPEWAIMADLYHTWWSKFDELVIEYETGFPSDSVIPERWDEAWRYSIGTAYQATEALQLRAGLVYDESPVTSDLYRSPRIPDADRLWVTLGLGYQVSEALRLDAAYVHIFVDDPVIDNPTHTAGEYLKGTITARTDILSVGLNYRF